MSITNIPPEILDHILSYCDGITQFRFKATHKNTIKITNLDVSMRLSSKITNDILQKNVFIKKLNLYDNLLVTNLDNLSHITELDISGKCIIHQQQITHLAQLTRLNISNNISISHLHPFTKLACLRMPGVCNISNDELNRLTSLHKLDITYNNSITCIDNLHLTQLVGNNYLSSFTL